MKVKKDGACAMTPAVNMDYRVQLPEITDRIVGSCSDECCFDNIGASVLPSRAAVIEITGIIMNILYPGYFGSQGLNAHNMRCHIGNEVNTLFERLSGQISRSIIHECELTRDSCTECLTRGQEEAVAFLNKIPDIRRMLGHDIRAAYDGDPAARSYDEVIFSYPHILAVTIYRVAHELHKSGIPLIPRIMTEHAHSITGIDIHPGAEIGRGFFIDHGTGVVIGETSVIANNVRLYQGVTLGSLKMPKDATGRLEKGVKRHPHIEDDVIIYANATILGGDVVIGARSIIGGNVWLTRSVPPDTKVTMSDPGLIFKPTDSE